MEHLSSVRPTGKFPEKVENLKRRSRFPGWNFRTECRVPLTFLVVCTSGPFHLISTPPPRMMFLFLQSLRNNVALTPSEIPMDEFKNIAAPLEIPMMSSSEKYYG